LGSQRCDRQIDAQASGSLPDERYVLTHGNPDIRTDNDRYPADAGIGFLEQFNPLPAIEG
jgi:hypothetical protein